MDKATQQILYEFRAKEWKKWLDFGVTVKLQGRVLDKLIEEGHKPIPTQWV